MQKQVNQGENEQEEVKRKLPATGEKSKVYMENQEIKDGASLVTQ